MECCIVFVRIRPWNSCSNHSARNLGCVDGRILCHLCQFDYLRHDRQDQRTSSRKRVNLVFPVGHGSSEAIQETLPRESAHPSTRSVRDPDGDLFPCLASGLGFCQIDGNVVNQALSRNHVIAHLLLRCLTGINRDFHFWRFDGAAVRFQDQLQVILVRLHGCEQLRGWPNRTDYFCPK